MYSKKKCWAKLIFYCKKDILWRRNRESFTPFSPQINKIELVKSGSVRRSKLYYLRKRSGKSARISEKNIYNKTEDNGENSNKPEQQDPKPLTPVDSTDNLKANEIKKNKDEKISEKVEESKSELEKN